MPGCFFGFVLLIIIIFIIGLPRAYLSIHKVGKLPSYTYLEHQGR